MDAPAPKPDPRLNLYAAPQTLVKVGRRRRINLTISGEGEPTVVLMNGLGGTTLSWARVQRRLEGRTRVVAYDHAGLGFSDPGPLPRTSDRIVADLRAALKAAGIAPPYVLVGQSASGLHSRLFAFNHPDEVAGLVLVDPSSPGQGERFVPDPAQRRKVQRKEMSRLTSLLAHARAGTLTDEALAEGAWGFRPDPKLPDALNAAVRAKKSAPAEWRTLASELRSFHGISTAQVRAATRPLGEKPLIVLSAGRQQIEPDEPGADERLAAWRAMHAEAAALSTRGEFRLVDAGHNMHVEAPAFVVDAVEEVLAAVR